MNIALCDDNTSFMKEFLHAIEKHCAFNDWSYTYVCFHRAKDLLAADLSSIHVLFLDIDIPEINGLNAAQELRAKYPELVIVFVTAYIEYAPKGYCVEAFRYLLKGELKTELSLCLNDIWDKLFKSQDSLQIHLLDRASIQVRIQDILFFEGTPHRHVLLHSTATPQPVECIGKLADYEDKLALKGFLRIQKSYLVNMFHINDIRNYHALLKDGHSLKVSQQNYADVRKNYILWKGRQL